jgi:NitT/TauT family transport system substrate-binding protein
MTILLVSCSLICTVAGTSVASEKSGKEITMGVQPWLGYGPWWIAAEKGFFTKHGVDVKVINFTWDADMGAAVSSGRLDVISAATNFLISLRNQNIDLKGFMVLDASYEADAILAPKTVTSIKDLKGKAIAYEKGATSDLLLNYALKKNDLKLADVKPVDMGAADAGLALIAGRVDIAVTYEPYISAALKHSDDHHVLYTSAEHPGLISDLAVSTGDFIQNNPEIIKSLILAWDDAVTYLREHPEEGGKIIADAVKSPMDEFKIALKGVKLYDLKGNAEILKGDFQQTMIDIAEIMKETNPKEITMIPRPEDALAIGDLVKLAD